MSYTEFANWMTFYKQMNTERDKPEEVEWTRDNALEFFGG